MERLLHVQNMKRHYLNIQKQKNILDGLPKTLRRLSFKIEAIPDIKPKEILNGNTQKKVIEGGNNKVSDQIKQWI